MSKIKEENEVVEQENVQEAVDQAEQLKNLLYKSMMFVCSKHGNITDQQVSMSYTVHNPETQAFEEKQATFCVACIAEYLAKLTEEGHLGKVSMGISKQTLDELGIDITSEMEKEAKAEEKVQEDN